MFAYPSVCAFVVQEFSKTPQEAAEDDVQSVVSRATTVGSQRTGVGAVAVLTSLAKGQSSVCLAATLLLLIGVSSQP